jgi:hypothetical protein
VQSSILNGPTTKPNRIPKTKRHLLHSSTWRFRLLCCHPVRRSWT